MSPARGAALAGLAWIAVGALVGAVALLATGGAAPGRLAALLIAGVLSVSVAGPLLAARGGALAAARGVLALTCGLGLAGLPLGGGAGLLGGALWVALLGLALAGLTLLAGRSGQVVATAAGLLLVAWPYLAGPLTAALPPPRQRLAMSATLLTPVPVLAGTFAGADPLRSPRLYRDFPLGQSVPFAYVAPRAALGGAAAVALALAALALLSAGRRRRSSAAPRALTRAAPVLALLLLAAAPGEARAQLFPEPTPGGEPVIGDLSTRVQLGYWLPGLTGYIKLDPATGQGGGSKLSFTRVLDLDPIFVLPTFEVNLAWENGGRVGIQYIEALWTGEETQQPSRFIEEAQFPPGSFLETRYRFRSIAISGELYIPVADFITLSLVTTTRYVKHEVRLRTLTPNPISRRDSVEALIPTLGVGADVLIWQMISAYGSIQWLDFRTSTFGGEDDRWEFSYREAHVGVRLELVQHAHVLVEWFWLETQVIDGRREKYRQQLMGPRLQVAILF